MVVLGMQFGGVPWSRPSWMRFHGSVSEVPEEENGEGEGARLLIGESRVAEEYHDEEEGEAQSVLRGADEGNRPRLEPSGLTADGEQWRE